MSDGLTVEFDVRFRTKAKGRKELSTARPHDPNLLPEGRVPRVSRLMALAIHVDELIRTGEIKDYAEAARLAQVTRARMTQIMNLINLAPEIQEEILLMPRTNTRGDFLAERAIRLIATESDWAAQRTLRGRPIGKRSLHIW